MNFDKLKNSYLSLLKGGDSKKKLKIMLLVFIAICLMFVKVPEKKEKSNVTYVSNESISNDDYKSKEEKRIEEFLKKIDGVNDAKVLLSMECGKEKVLAKTEDVQKSLTSESDASGGIRDVKTQDKKESTVYKSDNNPFVLRENEPEANGVVILINGNLNSKLRSYIIESMKAYLGISANKIQVYKMKG